jgi:putative transposase
VTFGLSTIERWYHRATDECDPVTVLRPKQRQDAGRQRVLGGQMKQALNEQYQAHKSWSYQLHADNLNALIRQQPDLGTTPSYSTAHRYMKASGLTKKRRILPRSTAGTLAAEQRLETREVRSYEADHIHGLWHLDYHHGSRNILTSDGRWVKPMLLAIMDDRSRVICHAQWYLNETTESLVHGFAQAIQKRVLPRALMTDNGSAMTSEEFTEGLERLSILHQTTLPYSPYQNGQQEFFWTNIEGRLLPMLEGEDDLALLNNATQAWLEGEYHHRKHSALGCAPIQRYQDDPNVGRNSPNSLQLRQAFRQQVKRKQRRSDGTISLKGNVLRSLRAIGILKPYFCNMPAGT